MLPSRRRLLRSCGAALLVGVAGCRSWSDTPNTRPPDPSECPDEPRVPAADPHQDGADLPPTPDHPDPLDETSAGTYAEAYELAREWRAVTATFSAPVMKVRIEASVEAERINEEVVLVTVNARPSGRIAFDGDTDSPGHFDGALYTASYLVTTDAVWRAESERGDEYPSPPPPREEGTLLVCF